MTRPALSLVVISYNASAYLRRCLTSIQSQINASTDEIIVVDNNSQDDSCAVVEKEFPGVTLCRSPRNDGFSYACNIGWRKAKNVLILISNGDVVFPPDQIEKLVDIMKAYKNIGLLSPELIGENNELIQMTWGWNISLFGEIRQKIFSPKNVSRWKILNKAVAYLQRDEKDVSLVAGACILVRREMMERIDGFDEDYELYFEDADLCVRCRAAGYQVRFTPRVRVFHGLGQSGKKNPMKIDLIYRQSQITYYRKHHSPLELAFLKFYLWGKFVLSQQFWSNSLFRSNILKILREKTHIRLNDEIQ